MSHHYFSFTLNHPTEEKLTDIATIPDNTDQISLIKMFKVCQRQFPSIMGEINIINIPGNLLSENTIISFYQILIFEECVLIPEGHVVVVTVAVILLGESSTRTHVLEVKRFHLKHRLYPLDRIHVHLCRKEHYYENI